MYDYGYSYGYGLIGGNTYNPLINYNWSTTTAKEYRTDGVELVTNGGFDTDTNWITEGGWSIIDGTATISSSDSNIHQRDVFVVGEIYKITYDVVSAGGGRINFRMPFSSNYYIANTIGTHTVYVKATYTTLMFRNESTTSTCKIDNISVQKVIEEPNKRYLKDVGSTPTYNASMYFGRGAYLNGVDQSITVPINTTIQTTLKRVNGIVTINETSQTLTNYVISGLGVHKDYYLFTRLLTPSEKDSYTNTPELFYAMAQADSTCVLNMPMCETDGYVRNMKSYSEVQKEYSDFNDGTTQGFTALYDSTVSVLNNQLKVTKVNNNPYIGKIYTSIVGNYYKLKVNCNNKSTASNIQIICSSDTSLGTSNLYLTQINAIGVESTYEIIVKATTTTTFFKIRGNVFTSVDDYFLIDNWEVTDLGTSIYPITNYTSSVRDNAKKLQYGLQTCKFVRDSLGVIQGASDYLECDGVGYANTGWISPLNTEAETIEIIFTEPLVVQDYYNKIFSQTGTSGTSVVEIAKGTKNSLTIRYRGITKGVQLTQSTVMLTLVASSDTSYIYFNGSLSVMGTKVAYTEVQSLLLGAYNLGTLGAENVNGTSIRLFKVHNKALTQAEITENYNSYVAKGLLS